MMADFVVPRHSAVMERLRRRIELFRRHHNSCENRYENTALERLELERQQTFALHQRCLQTKAKRSNKHRQPQQNSDQAGQRGPVTGVSTTDLGDGGTAGEQSRNSTLIALQETVKRKLESASSPLGRDQVNGFSDGYPPSKKSCLDNGTINGIPPHSPMDTKHGIGVAAGLADSLVSNGTHGPAGESGDCSAAEQEFRLKEMKQEPVDDILPCMLPSGGSANNSLFPDLNLNEQEWTELMEELNRSVAYEDIEEILNDGFEDRKEPPELAPTPGTGASGAGSSGGGGGGTQVQPGQPSQGLLPPDLASIKAEFSPASAAFEQDSRTGSPHVRPTSSAPPVHSTNSPAATSTASSPALPQPQQSQQPTPSRQLQPPNHLLQPGPPVSKDLSPAQHLQQLAAQKQRVQQMQNQLQQQQQQQKQQQAQKQQQQQQQQQAAKFHPQGSHPHPPSWPQTANPSQSPLGGAFGMDKPSSPSLYPQDFNPNNPKQLMMPGQPNKGSPKAGAGPYMQGSVGHPNMLGHSASGAPMSHPSSAGAQPTPSMLSYNNTKPLSHFEAMTPGAGPPRGPPNTQSQNKAALLSILRQQQMKNKAGMAGFRPHLPHAQQEQSAYTTTSHGPGAGGTMASQPGANAMAGNHGNAAYLNSQAAVAAALKQQQQHQQQQQMQMLEHQKQYLLGQRQQQMMVEQEKQRQQQEQQLQRHLTRPPPQYQDQQGQTATQNPFQQQQPVNQFPGSSQPVGNVGSMGGPAPGAQRMFPQNQGMMGMNMGQGSGPAGGGVPPPAASQADMNLPSCGGAAGMDVQQVLYSNMNMHPSHPGHPTHPSQQGSMQRQPVGGMNANYRQNLLAQQQHLKNQPNAALLKQQQLAAAAARLPGSLPNSIGANMSNAMPSAMQSAQSQAWQQQQQQQQQQQHQGLQQAMGSQPPSSNGGMPPNAFTNPNAFHMQQQQTRMPKMPTGNTPFGTNPNGRPMGGMNPRQQMMQTNMAAQQRAAPNPQTLGQPLGQPLPNQQSQQTQQQQQQAAQNQGVLPDLGAFGQPQGNSRQGLQCNQGFQVNRTANQQQQQQQQQALSFGYNAASGTGGLPSFPGESDLVDSLLKSQSTQEWMDDLDELLASHH